jgi:hypothetical protein
VEEVNILHINTTDLLPIPLGVRNLFLNWIFPRNY